ncbi:MAG: DUF2867 domain-containing protein [candidate division Zixibacteria bacterium]|nr:DUF2867 domain-containing protein [candidate division Zixibacteria bacterium]
MTVSPRILVTGPTGYIGGRLVPRLLEEGYPVRVLVRDRKRLQGRSWRERVEVAEGDAFKPRSLEAAMHSVDVAYYFIHSLYTGSNFHQLDLTAAHNFGSAARASGVKRIIYLGGLGDPRSNLSEHLKSRQLTGKTLREGGVPVTEFRAAIIVGSGSASFEMIRYLAERVPLMICPRWVFSKIQPIAVTDVMNYLAAALRTPESTGQIIEIGGAEVLTYGDTMLAYARIRGLRRIMIRVPVLSPGLSSHWVHWVTPVSAKIARPLIEGLRNQVIVRNDLARRLFPQICPMDYEAAVRLALSNLQAGSIETAWSDALITSEAHVPPVTLTSREGMMIKSWQWTVKASPESIFGTFTGLGGQRGWLYADGAWRLRGIADRLAGGVGLRRGRRHPNQLRAGDAVDFWRVEGIEPGRLLRLRSEMKAPGQLWLQFEVRARIEGEAVLTQTLFYAPKGLLGLVYWYVFYPLHNTVFSGLVGEVARQAENSGDKRW